MKNKYELLLSLKLLEYEIKQLTIYSKECNECFDLLKNKLDYLCKFMTNDENLKQWNLWENHRDVRQHCERLRETSVKALCDMEKYQSLCTSNHKLDISEYFTSLSESVKSELEDFGIDRKSKVLFIGSGAFPISALTIANEIRAEVMCLDIDREALNLGEQVANISGLQSMVKFSNEKLRDVAFLKEATHIIVASLVKNKTEVLDELKGVIGLKTKILLRYGDGLKSVFNYPLDKKLSAEWVQTLNCQSKNIYDTIILEKAI
ncbi:nicotianamine synthase family protein [Pelosinus baikalensis]|uniref:Nicotianamine synthase n=1 Tax=Pelosinus baikalensis TaxID=2892015 RepID=A0ABS8HYD2_9FIRM|nr:nicotianamine synthase family protein [Pelosinus baikalensis]MCC5468025.1 hypothetical protein [Pelosinus baikalensis]